MKYLLGLVAVIGVSFIAVLTVYMPRTIHPTPTHVSKKQGAIPEAVQKTKGAGLSSDGKKLNLNSSDLTEVTADIYSKTSVVELVLYNNHIKTLPPEMGNMTNLEVVDLTAAGLQSLFPDIYKWSNLRSLAVSTNDISTLPPEIGQLRKLQTLDVGYNNLNLIPDEISNLKDTLKKLVISGNPMTEEEAARVKAMLPQTDVVFADQ